MGGLEFVVTAKGQDLISEKGQSEPHLIALEKREPCSRPLGIRELCTQGGSLQRPLSPCFWGRGR